MSEIIKSIEKAQLRTDRPDFNVGDTLRVFVKVVEGNRERLQAFEGTVIARRNGSCRGRCGVILFVLPASREGSQRKECQNCRDCSFEFHIFTLLFMSGLL